MLYIQNSIFKQNSELLRPNGAMVLSTLIQKNSLLVESEESVLSIKMISQ